MCIGKTARTIAISIALTSGIAASTVVAQTPRQLELKAYLNEPGGPQIMEGLYLEAAELIETKLGSLSVESGMIAANNLCVARTMLGDFDGAQTACNSAVRRARAFERSTRDVKDRPSAIARNNRAVLNVVLGNIDLAIADLERSAAIERADGTAQAANLAYIGQLSMQSVADTD